MHNIDTEDCAIFAHLAVHQRTNWLAGTYSYRYNTLWHSWDR